MKRLFLLIKEQNSMLYIINSPLSINFISFLEISQKLRKANIG